MNNLTHSAEGTTWSKKNHKYIRKEGNRYIYEDSVTKTKTARDILGDKGITRAEKRPHNAGERYYSYANSRERGTIVNEGARSAAGIENFHAKVNVRPRKTARGVIEGPTAKSKTAREILSDKGITRAEKRHHNAGERYYNYDTPSERGTIVNEGSRSSKGIENFHAKVNTKTKTSARDHLNDYRYNQTIKDNPQARNYENHNEALREKAMVASKKDQAYKAYLDSQKSYRTSIAPQIRGQINQKFQKKVADRRELERQKAEADRLEKEQQLKSASLNRGMSNARPVRDVLSDRRQNRVAYVTNNDGSRRRVTQYKYKPGETRLVSSGRTARDRLSDRGIRRVSYNNTENGRQKTVTTNDFKRKATDVTKNFGSKDSRSAFKKKVSDFGKKIGIGRDAIYNYTQGVKQASKERVKEQKAALKEQKRKEREADRQIPLSMRLKRNSKRGKKALAKYFPFLN